MTPREGWREAVWRDLEGEWDVVVVGGGITGVAVLLEAARRGLKALLLEQGDFASGTSSRSSKLVHGGLRYLAQGALGLTWASVRERDRLMAELPGLVEPVGFLLASYGRDHVGPRSLGLGLTIYDWLGRGVRHRSLSSGDLSLLAPRLTLENLVGAFSYRDAQTDDARLVLRTLFEALALGAEALSRARVEELLTRDGQVTGVAVRDLESGAVSRVRASAVVNATGAWADGLRAGVGGRPALRPLRGSHLLFPRWRFPVAQAVAFCHPIDGRPLFAYPWEGLTLLGTTDRDHGGTLEEPAMSPEEASYLVEAARGAFPGLEVTVSDAVSSYAGVRPVVGTGAADPRVGMAGGLAPFATPPSPASSSRLERPARCGLSCGGRPGPSGWCTSRTCCCGGCGWGWCCPRAEASCCRGCAPSARASWGGTTGAGRKRRRPMGPGGVASTELRSPPRRGRARRRRRRLARRARRRSPREGS